jgi:hypothetical protein
MQASGRPCSGHASSARQRALACVDADVYFWLLGKQPVWSMQPARSSAWHRALDLHDKGIVTLNPPLRKNVQMSSPVASGQHAVMQWPRCGGVECGGRCGGVERQG